MKTKDMRFLICSIVVPSRFDDFHGKYRKKKRDDACYLEHRGTEPFFVKFTKKNT